MKRSKDHDRKTQGPAHDSKCTDEVPTEELQKFTSLVAFHKIATFPPFSRKLQAGDMWIKTSYRTSDPISGKDYAVRLGEEWCADDSQKSSSSVH